MPVNHKTFKIIKSINTVNIPIYIVNFNGTAFMKESSAIDSIYSLTKCSLKRCTIFSVFPTYSTSTAG